MTRRLPLAFLVIALSFLSALPARAARTITTVTLDGGGSVVVAAGATISATVSVTTDGAGSNARWHCTGWSTTGATSGSADHANFDSAGNHQTSFNITAPAALGTYSASFIAYRNNDCDQGASSTYTLNNAITVVRNCTSNVASGNWNTAGTWTNCGGGVPQAGDMVTILNGHTVTLNTNPPSLIRLVNNGTLRDSGNSRTLTMAGNIANAGTLDLGSSTVRIAGAATWSGNGTWNLGTIDFNWQNQALALATGATFTLNLFGATPIDNLSSGQGSFNAGANTTATVNFARSGNQTIRSAGIVYPNLSLSGGGTKTPDAWATLDIRGSLAIGNGVTYTNGSSSAVDLYGNFQNNGTFNSGWGDFTFRGSGVQTVGGSPAFLDLIVNNPSGLLLNSDISIANNGILTLTSGPITTGAHRVIVSGICASNFTLNRTSGFIAGNLRLTFPDYSATCIYPVGSGTSYTPISVTMGSSGGTLTGYTTAGEHPQILTAGINASRNANRHWTLGAAGDTLTSAASYSATFTFVSADLDAGVSDGSAFKVQRYNDSAWQGSPAGSGAALSATITGQTGFGSFAVGETGNVSLIAEYRFDECSWTSGQASQVADSSGNGYHATPFGANPVAGGVVQQAADLSPSGTADYIRWPRDILHGRGDFTVMVWFKTTISQAQQEILHGLGSDADDDEIEIYLVNANQIRVNLLDNGNTYTAGSNFTDGNWHHLAVTRSGSSLCVYLDGASLGCNNRGNTTLSIGNANALISGQEQDAYGGSFENSQSLRALLDEFKVFGVALSAGQISAIRSNELAGNNWDGTSRGPSACHCVTYDFTGANDASPGADWTRTSSSGSFGLPRIHSNRLRLTDAGANVATAAHLQKLFPGSGNKIVVEFDYFAYNGDGADGVALTFSDATQAESAGAYGGSLGYAQRCGVDGFVGGWLGVGIDEYGNFRNDEECRGDGGSPTGRVQDSVSVRGSGSGTTGYRIHEESGGLSPGVDQAGATPGPGHRYRITIDHTDDVHAYVTVERDTTGSGSNYATIIPRYDAKAKTGQAAVPANWKISYTGSTGGSNNIHEIDNLRICAAQPIVNASGPHHVRIEHPTGTGVTCSPATLTLRACADANCNTLHTSSVSGNLTATPVTGTPTVNWVAGNGFTIPANGTTTVDVQVTTAGSVVFGTTGLSPTAANATTCDFSNCTFTSSLAGFLFDVPHHAADTTQNITISAVRQADNSLACTPAFASISKSVSLGCVYDDPASGTHPVRIGSTDISCSGTSNVSLAFNASGVAATTLRYADVGRINLSASYTGSGGSEAGLVMTGGASFITAPASFTVTPSAGPYVAGSPFNATIIARNASGATTPNFGKESTTETVHLDRVLVTPAGGNNPALGGTTSVADSAFGAGNGEATASGITWGEVGTINLTATLSDYMGSGLNASGSGAVGPFRPAYFETEVTPGGNGFTYSGQPFSVTVTAKNAAGVTTQNYAGSHARDVALSDANAGTNSSGTLGSFSNASIAAGAFSGGVGSTSTIAYAFNTKTTAPLESPGPLPLSLRATDTDGVSSSGHVEGFTPIRAGRLRLINFYGSERLRPRIEYRAEYWDGARWRTNTNDNSSPIAAGNISTAGLTVQGVTGLTGGVGFITFNPAATGAYDIALNLGNGTDDDSCNAAHGGGPASRPWLRGFWAPAAQCGGTAAWEQDPNARIRLGSPKAPYIYLRERY